MAGLTLAPQAARLRASTWSSLFRHAWIAFLAAGFLRLVLPATLVHTLHPLLKVAPLLPFLAKDLVHLPDALARTRGALALRDWRALCVAWLAPELVGLLRLDSALRRGFLGWLLRRPQPALAQGQGFGYLERGSYGTLVAMVLFSMLVELPVDAAIVPLFFKNAHQRHLIHLVTIIGCLSSLVWVLGDRWLVGAGKHVLDDCALHLRIGARTRGTIPRHAIRACAPLAGTREQWCSRHGIDPRRTLLASPLDKPNTVLILDPDSPVRLVHLGVERTGLACVFLYLDSPHALVSALADPPGMDAYTGRICAL